MPTSPSARLALTGPTSTESADGPLLASTLISQMESVVMRRDVGTAAARASASHITGRIWVESDTGQIYWDDGTNWQPISRRMLQTLTSLPSSPADGDRAILNLTNTNAPGGTCAWEFVYDLALHASDGYGWKFAGGSPLIAENRTSYTFPANGTENSGGANPSITIPVTGYYDVETVTDLACPLATTSLRSEVSIGGFVFDTDDFNGWAASVARVSRITIPKLISAGSSVFIVVAAQAASGNATAYRRLVRVTPVRVQG